MAYMVTPKLSETPATYPDQETHAQAKSRLKAHANAAAINIPGDRQILVNLAKLIETNILPVHGGTIVTKPEEYGKSACQYQFTTYVGVETTPAGIAALKALNPSLLIEDQDQRLKSKKKEPALVL